MSETPARPRIRSRRIIERPRLLSVLDRSRARVKTLVAGPGYGKTVALEQWAGHSDQRLGWYRARRSATDVAVVARALQAAAEPLVAGAGRRMLERLSVTNDPEREAVLLAEMLAEDLDAWPDDAWLLIDDYHHLATTEASERFVETLVQRSPVQLLIASRVRPIWVSAKALLYGDVLEVTQAMLSMTIDEAEAVLEGGYLDLSPGLLALAGGWPAVIGLAGMAPNVTEVDADMPDALYAFFAEELHRGLDPQLADDLGLLASLPCVDRELALELLGPERAARACDDALALGILDERDGRLEFHPLASAFMAQHARETGLPGIEVAVPLALASYQRRHDWDSAIELVAAHGDPDSLATLLAEALDELLSMSRLSTLEASLKTVADRMGDIPIVVLGKASLSLRHGHTLVAQEAAETLHTADDGWIRFRGLMLAGAAAHAGSREVSALSFYERAEIEASDPARRRSARWGQLMAATALELSEAPEMLRALVEDAPPGLIALETIREADKTIALGLRFGAVTNLSQARQVEELLIRVDDPVVRASYRTTLSCALNLAAEYREAQRIATELHDEAEDLRIEFALPYGSLMIAAASAGMRLFERAHESLELAAHEAHRCADRFAMQAIYAARVRVLVQQRRIGEACSLEPPDIADALPGMRGEVLASRGLALACLGRLDEAVELGRASADATSAIEAAVLGNCIAAVVALKRRDDSLLSALRHMLTHAYACGGVDLVVTTYRGCPEVLDSLMRMQETAETAGFVVSRAGDEPLAEALGVRVDEALDPVRWLTNREREVYSLVCQGVSTSRIAKTLFISEATVKVHVHHIFDKIGLRSRAALVLDAASRGLRQAAPTEAAGATPTAPE